MTSGFSHKWAAVCVLGVLCTVQILFGYSHWAPSTSAWGNDDAHISYRYAANLADGHGLVYNPGEAVEGYSNLLFVLILSTVLRFAPAEHAYAYSSGLNLLLALAALLVFHRIVSRWAGSDAASPAIWVFALLPSLWSWTASGMETSLVLLLLFYLWERVELCTENPDRHYPSLYWTIAAVVLARADGFVYASIAVAFLALSGRWDVCRRAAVALTATMAGLTLWRYGYYGDLLPNTYHAKVSGPVLSRLRSAVSQMVDMAWRQGLALHLLILTGAAVSDLRAMPSRLAAGLPICRFPVLFAAGLGSYWLYIGGDHLIERFLLIVVGMSIAIVTSRLTAASTPVRATALALIVLIQFVPLLTDSRFRYSRDKYDCWITLGKELRRTHAGDVLAIDAAGKVPFFSGLRTLDMLGLNDRTIGRLPAVHHSAGHNKYDPQYVLSTQPDLVAAWIDRDMNLSWGLTRQVYEPAGYRVRYLVNSTPRRKAVNVLDVAGRSPDQILELFERGYRYGVLGRENPE